MTPHYAKINNKITRIFLFLIVLLLNNIIFSQTIRYVKPTVSGSGDGSSWANASNNLQSMINNSASNDQVWVAAGTYKPNAYPSNCTNCNTNRV